MSTAGCSLGYFETPPGQTSPLILYFSWFITCLTSCLHSLGWKLATFSVGCLKQRFCLIAALSSARAMARQVGALPAPSRLLSSSQPNNSSGDLWKTETVKEIWWKSPSKASFAVYAKRWPGEELPLLHHLLDTTSAGVLWSQTSAWDETQERTVI